jgi:ascorbate PTS system EIIA or EIIAB component
MKFLEESLVGINVEVSSPIEAIKAAGNLLLKQGLIEDTYVQAMVNSYQQNGPYFVLAPHVALPHARPEDGVNEASVSFVQLKSPIEFGSKTNDPVRLVFALGASSSDEHLQILQKLSKLLGDPAKLEKLETIKDYQELKEII